MWRQGDILIATVDTLPEKVTQRDTLILAHGENSGHYHRVAAPNTAKLWEQGGMLFLHVIAHAATVIHEEHHALTLPQGVYRVWGQREYIAANIAPRPVLPEPADDEVFLLLAGAQIIDADRDAGGERRLLCFEAISGEDMVSLAVTCPSSGKHYRIRVPPNIQTCHAAAAWVAGFDDPDQYHPIIET